jgi:hypothetical protein
MTVSGLAKTKEDRQSFQISHSHAHKSRPAGAPQNAELVPQREVLKMECGSGFEGRRRRGAQHVKGAERQVEELMEYTQIPCSHSVRHLR